MNNVFARVKGLRKKPYFKVVSDYTLFDTVDTSRVSFVPYEPDHNLDDDSWFKIDDFSQQEYCLSFLKEEFDSKNYNELEKNTFLKYHSFLPPRAMIFYFKK